MKTEIGEDSFLCKCRTKDIVVNPSTSRAYRNAVKYLQKMNAEYHTYQLKEDKSMRVVIRFLHHTTPTDVIKNELEAMGFAVRNVTNALHPLTRQPLSLFFVDLEPDRQSHKIYELKSLLQTIVKIEEPRKKRVIPQCVRCQDFGHTKGYCNHPPRCVKCAGNHLTSDCQKTRETSAKCVHCQGAHPANYRGCLVYSELKKRQHKDDTRPVPPPPRTSPPQRTSTSYPLLPSISSAQPKPINSHHVAAPAPHRMESSLHPTYASVTQGHGPNSQVSHPITHIPPPPSSVDMTSLLNSFLSELKSVITPLISLLTQMMTSLIPTLSAKS